MFGVAGCADAPAPEPAPMQAPGAPGGTGGQQSASSGTGGAMPRVDAGNGTGGRAATQPAHDAGKTPVPQLDAAMKPPADAAIDAAPKCPDVALLSAGDHDQ